jgi:hypothetical protein
LLEKEIKEREDKIKEMDEEVKHREEVRLQIDNALKDFVIDEDVKKSYILHDLEFCDHIEIKLSYEEDKVIEVKSTYLGIKMLVLKDLKLKAGP